ncbi:AAA family ATPase [Deinococcus daejeonensis]|uniref:ATP-binding protein n=1 Tax=Deinococcus daejeonensis TaxID=1007098 RepID=A0ABQ2JGN2_9DEIO|nr:ATP-binding protein [Deinococcus daejeonensis]GGN46078.1 ATP-binding protein [Deinococcus daejeonensis]
MITRLHLRNFTVFAAVDLEFSSQLNVIIGENGTGKTHLLKVLYAMQRVAAFQGRRSEHRSTAASEQSTGLKLQNVFRVQESQDLVRNAAPRTEAVAEVTFNSPEEVLRYSTLSEPGAFTIEKNRRAGDWEKRLGVYLPAREMLTIFPNFVSVYESTVLEFDETWRDTSVLLGAPQLRNPDPWAMKAIEQLGRLIGGEIVLQSGRFYLKVGKTMREASLLAEGHRKLATVAQLIANGSLQNGSCLFWDEPEANLNPKLVRQAAQVIMVLAREGVQVFIATHSLFLLRELEILGETDFAGSVAARYFGLHGSQQGVEVMQGDTPYDMGNIAALEEELRQTDRFLAANEFARERLEAAQSGKRKTKKPKRQIG